MTFVLTVIADPTVQKITPELIRHHLGAVDPVCLSEGEAYDVFSETAFDLVALRESFAGFDLIQQPVAGRRKKLLVADMDSTIVTSETLDDLADYAGIKDQIAEITQRAMNGELDFHAALRERVMMLKGLDQRFLEETLQEITLMGGARELVTTMRAHGAYCALVSGGFTFFTGQIAAQVGFDFNAGNQLEIVDGVLSGHVNEPILDKDSKLMYLKKFAEERGLELSETATVGDGANDLPMLLAAGLGVAYHAKPAVKAQAHHQVSVTNLKGLLFAQGYTQDMISA